MVEGKSGPTEHLGRLPFGCHPNLATEKLHLEPVVPPERLIIHEHLLEYHETNQCYESLGKYLKNREGVHSFHIHVSQFCC